MALASLRDKKLWNPTPTASQSARRLDRRVTSLTLLAFVGPSDDGRAESVNRYDEADCSGTGASRCPGDRIMRRWRRHYRLPAVGQWPTTANRVTDCQRQSVSHANIVAER